MYAYICHVKVWRPEDYLKCKQNCVLCVLVFCLYDWCLCSICMFGAHGCPRLSYIDSCEPLCGCRKIKPGSSARAANGLNFWAISPCFTGQFLRVLAFYLVEAVSLSLPFILGLQMCKHTFYIGSEEWGQVILPGKCFYLLSNPPGPLFVFETRSYCVSQGGLNPINFLFLPPYTSVYKPLLSSFNLFSFFA